MGSQLPGVEPEAPREHEIRDAAQRFGADHDIVERYAQLLDRNTFHGVTERAQARINAGTARDTPALFVEILKRAVVGQAREDVRAAAAAPPTVDEQVVLEARDYARMRTPWDAARPLLERALRRRGIHDNDELERLLAAAEDAYRNDEAAAATGHNP